MQTCSHCSLNIENPITFIERYSNGSCSSHKYKIYFCNDVCHNLFKTIDECQICNNRANNFELINGFRVCTLNEDWVDKPTCMQRYTGNYHCIICDKDYNVEKNKGFTYHDYEDDECDKYYNICNLCYKGDKYHHQFSKDKWLEIYHHHDGYDTLKMLMKIILKKFCCNNCNRQKQIRECNIVDDKNICDDCFQQKVEK